MSAGFTNALEALLRPLRFAAQDDFAQLARVRDLDRVLREGCEALARLAIPSDLRERIEKLGARFSDREGDALSVLEVKAALDEVEAWARPELRESCLARPLQALPGVGPKRAETLAQRGLCRVSDLLFRLPTRYDDRRALASVAELEVGRRATFMAEVKSLDLSSRFVKGRRQQMLQAVVADETGSVTLKWFRGGSGLAKQLEAGLWLLVTGDVKRYRFTKEIVHPEIEPIDCGANDGGAGSAPDAEVLRSVAPVYSVPEGMTPRTLRRLIEQAVTEYSDLLEGHLPEKLVRELDLPEPGLALRCVHAPAPDASLDGYAAFASPAHQRLVLEELYLLELGLVLRRAQHAQRPGIAIDVEHERVRASEQSLPFTLTRAQQRAWHEIRRDLARPHPMHRLLQGDVGSGKTAVALLAAVAVAASGRQTALMAPTELLAEQHARTLRSLGAGSAKVLGLRVGLLTSSLSKLESNNLLTRLAAGEIDLVVGTHALIQDRVAFRDLALAVVDEQHRFGVLQRGALAERAAGEAEPHVLVMTATPIPRTLAMTLYGDLDVSVIDELPPGRSPCETLHFGQGDGRRIMQMIRDTAERGEQVYVVYPLVEESEKLDLRSAIESSERIAAAFPDLRVELVHGRVDGGERGRIMDAFARGEVQILVATTVIEVGVDVANATLMIIEHADRFGLAQLHQLRGRVGRGERAGTCVLVQRGRSQDGQARLAAMMRTTDGFEIADADLEIRGPGEFLGTRQSGELVDLRLADLVRDGRLLARAREAAIDTLERDPELRRDPRVRRAVEARWGPKLDLTRIG